MFSHKYRKLKIAIIGNLVTSGSNEVFLRKFLRILLPMSETIFVISDWKCKPLNDKIVVVDSIRMFTQRFMSSSLFAKLTRFFLIQLIICVNLLKSAKYARIILVFPIPMILPMLLAKLRNRKVVIFAAAQVHGTSLEDKSFKQKFLAGALELAKTGAFALSDHIIVESKSLIYWLNLGRYAKKVDVGPTYVDTDVFKPQKNVNNRRNVIGYIGILAESKGVKQFVQSIPLVIEKNLEVEFLIGGTGPCYPEIRRMILNYKLLDKVKLMGWIPNSEVHKYLNRLKLLVLPSASEGLPNIIIEAMSCGTPVLATGVGGVPDVVKDGETGFILENDSPEFIARNIVKVLESDNLDKVSKKARHLIETKYSYEAAVERYRKILESI
jgi:glycosyltransferase involved in cell wall biosynthesis